MYLINNKLDEAQKHLQEVKQILVEDYGIGFEALQGEYPSETEQGVGEEEVKGGNMAKQDERIAQIREIALQGLQDNAHNVDSEQYQFYKKIWLMCDKAVSEKDTVGGNGMNSRNYQ